MGFYGIGVVLVILCLQTAVADPKISITSNGPAIRGSNITFTATVTGYHATDKIQYVFWDDAQPANSMSFYSQSNTSTWSVEYSRDVYEAGDYTVKVELKKSFFDIYYVVDTAATTFKLTDSLNGNLTLIQNNTVRPNSYVAVNQTVRHFVKLPEIELQFLSKKASSIVTYWFIDCMYIDQTFDFTLDYLYMDLMSSHRVDALVVADHEPLPPLPTTTTSTTTTTTSTTTTTTPKPTSPGANSTTPEITTAKPVTSEPPVKLETTAKIIPPSSKVAHSLSKRALGNKVKKKHVGLPEDFICKNTIIPLGKSFSYGHYQETISVREPVGSQINITGLNWLQHGDLMNLQVKYTGSPPFDYCAQYKLGHYNVTGNETCKVKTRTISNVFPLVHYFTDSDQYTVVVIIENDVGKVVSRATINIYKASVHAQLSVIVVPVVFCLLAVILVVFGVAYYQHRSRHTIEVADFDFGQQSHFDYKTFKERLRDNFRNALNLHTEEDADPLTSDTTRYDSMTT